MAHGVPVIASRIGSLPEVIREGRTGMLFEAGNAQELAQKMRWARENPGEMQIMGRAARADHQERFSAQENYRLLRAVYDDAIAAAPI
jgi:glycosyltransferase involved in cell wall biosynthesis